MWHKTQNQMRYIILLFIIVFIASCKNSLKEINKENLEKLIDETESFSIKQSEDINEKGISETLNKGTDNWSDEKKIMDFRKTTGLVDSIILLNHFKQYYEDYTDYCYTFIDFQYGSIFHNQKQDLSYNCTDDYCLKAKKQIESLNIDLAEIELSDSLPKHWCILYKYDNILTSSNSRLTDLYFDKNYFVIQYMDGPYAKFITGFKKKEYLYEFTLLSQENIINGKTQHADTLKIHLPKIGNNYGIFEFISYNEHSANYSTQFQLYATADFCKNLPVLATIETEYDICGAEGIEYDYDWCKYKTEIELLETLINNSNIPPTFPKDKSDFIYSYSSNIHISSILGDNIPLLNNELDTVKILKDKIRYYVTVNKITDSLFPMTDLVDGNIYNYPYYHILLDTSTYWVGGNYIFGHAGSRTGMMNGKEKYTITVYRNSRSTTTKCPIIISDRKNRNKAFFVPIIRDKQNIINSKILYLDWQERPKNQVIKDIVFSGDNLTIGISEGNQRNEEIYRWKIKGVLSEEFEVYDRQ